MKRSGTGGWKAFDFGPEREPVSQSPVKKIPKTIRKNAHPKRNNIDFKNIAAKQQIFNFNNSIAPKSISDLAVHPKKIQEVEEWLKINVKNQELNLSSFLLLSGPTGSGKTATINVLCKNMGISISEWVNPMDQDYELCRGPNQVNRFLEFLTESKWNSLFEVGNVNRVTLVKDFPNAVIHQPEEFFNIVEECYYKIKYPIIFICTDASSRGINLSKTLFPEEIITKYKVTHISFNACAPSLMKNALKRAQSLVRENSDLLKQPSSSTIDAILATAMGDIRNAMNQFYLASLLGTEELPTVTNKTLKASSKRKRSDKVSTLQCMSRDENLGLFHGLGRVLNPKRKDVETGWRLNCDVEKIVDEFSIQPTMFISFLFENYLKYFGDIEDASRAADILSLSVKYFDNWVDRHETLIFGLWISVLGLMIFNEHRVSKWNQIRGPTKIDKRVNNGLGVTRIDSTDCFYFNLINKTDTFHKFKIDT